jgi:hypothetical protein
MGHRSLLASLEDVLAENTRLVDELEKRLRLIIPAWCRTHKARPPEFWASLGEHIESMRELCGAAGILDFERIEESRAIALLQERDAWPNGMPTTTSLTQLGLSEQDLAQQELEREQQERERELKRQSIVLGGAQISANRDNYGEIANLVQTSISQEFLRCSTRIARLEEIPAPRSRSGGGGSTSEQPSRRPEFSPDQRKALGFVGEVAAFTWLQANYPRVTIDAWKSTYKEILYAGTLGDDSLGYDFEVVQPSQTLLFEVKAGGEDTQFELGESQIRVAERYARSDRFRILWVHGALNIETARIYTLPNPLGERGRGMYRHLGKGLSYQFRLPR